MRSSPISPVALFSGGPASAGRSPSTVVGLMSDTTSASTGRSEIDSKLLSPLPRRDFGLAMADIGGTPFPLADMVADPEHPCSTWNMNRRVFADDNNRHSPVQ